MVAHCKIYPGIGIARLGNSPNEFFIASEAPGHAPTPEGGFKDSEGRIKRQASRFRIYAYDDQNNVVQEITTEDADITWTVHLANKKASWHEFHGRYHPDQPLRNNDIQNTPQNPDARAVLVIDPGARSISGPNKSGLEYRFDGGKFFHQEIPLGELRTDEAGHLLVLGGYGDSGSIKLDNPITHYANNDSWFDDTSDGSVTAKVVLKNGKEIPVTGSWVLVTPPNYAPQIDNLVSLYDVAKEVAVNQNWFPVPDRISFTQDVYPILVRGANYQWVNARSFRGHGPGTRGDFSNPKLLEELADNTGNGKSLREYVFNRFRDPEKLDPAQANYYFMPQLSGDDGDVEEKDPKKWLTVIKSQYEVLKRWAEGNFENDWTGTSLTMLAFTEIPVKEQPSALDRAALEPCVGGAFFPGIEMTYISTDKETYSEPFRLKAELEPGDITKYMAVPWQADFYECQIHWWPAQRPDDVVTEQEFIRATKDLKLTDPKNTLESMLAERKRWDRGIAGQEAIFPPPLIQREGETKEQYDERVKKQQYIGDNDMVAKWSQLGFVVAKEGINGDVVFVETERDPYVGMSEREYFYMMMNIDAFPDFLPKARSLAYEFLAQAWAMQSDPVFPSYYRYFDYSKDAFEAQLDEIYNNLVNQAATYNPSEDPVFKTKEDIKERIRQLAPFNQLDGAWLRNVTRTGPINEVHALLFGIWMDEAGNGTTELNHCNLYSDLLHSVGIYLQDVNTRDYADNPEMLDSAYTTSLFELVISQFSESFFPELLGMTLQLEWEVVGLVPTRDLFSFFGIDSQFYSLHIGIDNAAAGHGAKAKRAVDIYLDQVLAASGEEAVQESWKRIWNGYIAFALTGTVGQDLADLLEKRKLTPMKDQLRQRMIEMLERKKPFASLNHGTIKVGPMLLNDWFEDPDNFLTALVDNRYINPDEPEKSYLFTKFEFTGPMYKVFSDEEIKLWHDWAHSLKQAEPAAISAEKLRPRRTMSLVTSVSTEQHPQGKIWGRGAVH
ncbi:LodA/GoxA family CTQ-dependent oxidase [Nostoc sp.]|uniref:LodA/GoxA family CTQ-dependent oxidase n=1 Tax=Nostoc sp. TaxID=1180 RepID=UPI002FFD02B5